MRKAIAYAAIVCCAIAIPYSTSADRTPPPSVLAQTKWEVFRSEGGWSITFPHGWQVSSCHTCSDPHTAGNFVMFGSGVVDDDDSVMVEPLAPRPANQRVKQWLDDLKHNANLNPIAGEQWITLNGKPALQVTYRYQNSSRYRVIYVVDGSRAYSLTGPTFPTDASYDTFKRMVASFKFDSATVHER